MTNITDFHPIIQLTVRYLADPSASLSSLGQEVGITKQAVHKKVGQGVKYLEAFIQSTLDSPKNPELDKAKQENEFLLALNQRLRRELCLAGVDRQLLRLFKSKVLEFFPRFTTGSVPALEKKQILSWLSKFKAEGGLLKNFAERINKSPDTLSRWQEAYEKHGLNGLVDKHTRPKNFGNKVPLWIKNQLVLLFLKFPRWTPYQYHSYIRHNPTTQWYVSLPTIQKLKNMHQQKSETEKTRLKKRWCFAPGTKVWTIDFTCILKTQYFKLQLLTISDHRSRFLFPTALFLNTSTEIVVDYLEELFLKFGKPFIVKVDNGPEFRMHCSESLKELSVYLLNSPEYYGQFNGAHERIHRTLKAFIDNFDQHHNLTRLAQEIAAFEEQYNYSMTLDYLEGRTPANVYFNDQSFTPKNTEIVTPYEKNGEWRIKFIGRDGNPARLALPIIK